MVLPIFEELGERIYGARGARGAPGAPQFLYGAPARSLEPGQSIGFLLGKITLNYKMYTTIESHIDVVSISRVRTGLET